MTIHWIVKSATMTIIILQRIHSFMPLVQVNLFIVKAWHLFDGNMISHLSSIYSISSGHCASVRIDAVVRCALYQPCIHIISLAILPFILYDVPIVCCMFIDDTFRTMGGHNRFGGKKFRLAFLPLSQSTKKLYWNVLHCFFFSWKCIFWLWYYEFIAFHEPLAALA